MLSSYNRILDCDSKSFLEIKTIMTAPLEGIREKLVFWKF